MKIGDTLYFRDENRRVYAKPEPGQIFSSGRPIYAEHFRPLKIIGENRASWLLSSNQKVGKKNIDVRLSAYFTAQGMADDIWAHDHRHKLMEKVRGASVEELRRVAAIFE